MEKYITFIASIILAIQITRVSQRAINFLNKNDLERRIMVDKLLVELLPKIAAKYEENNETVVGAEESDNNENLYSR